MRNKEPQRWSLSQFGIKPQRMRELWQESTILQRVGWGLVSYDLLRQPVLGQRFNTTLLAIGTLLIGTRSRKLRERQDRRNTRRGLVQKDSDSDTGGSATT